MAKTCPKCHNKIEGTESYCPFCKHFLGERSVERTYKSEEKMQKYAGLLYCGMCVISIIMLILFLYIPFW